jgi:uncharacterized phage-like protein YoqJ
MIEYGYEAIPPRPKTVREKAAVLAAMTEEEKRLKRCCFTGHRPPKLSRPVDDIKVDLENEILASIDKGYTTFITGMACGTDIWAGNIVVRLKDRFPDLRLIAAVPFPAFPDGWEPVWRKKYETLLEKADLVKVISPEYHDAVYALRNRWMIDHSAKLIAVYNGRPGGTGNTIRYARDTQRIVRCLKG